VPRPQNAEVAFVERQDPIRLVTVGEDDEGGVDEADLQVAMARYDILSHVDVLFFEGRELIRAAADFGEEAEFRLDPRVTRD